MENSNDIIGNRNREIPAFKTNANSTWSSQTVTHLSTEHAQRCLAAVIEEELVFTTWYGHWLSEFWEWNSNAQNGEFQVGCYFLFQI